MSCKMMKGDRFVDLSNEAKRIAKDIISVATKLKISTEILKESIETELYIDCSTKEANKYKIESSHINTKEQAAEWLAKEWLKNKKDSEDDDYGEAFEWDKKEPPTAKDFLDNPLFFEDYAKCLLNFDTDTPDEKAFYALVVRVLDIGLGRKKK